MKRICNSARTHVMRCPPEFMLSDWRPVSGLSLHPPTEHLHSVLLKVYVEEVAFCSAHTCKENSGIVLC